MRRLLTRFWSDEDGLSAVEFALVSTFILVPLLLGATELGRRAWMRAQFDNATQAGIDFAIVQGCANATTCAFTSTGITNAVQTATALGTGVTVAAPTACNGAYYCYGCPGTSGVSLTAASGNCGTGGTSGTYAGLTTTYTYTPLFSSCGDWLPSAICGGPITWTVTAVTRVY